MLALLDRLAVDGNTICPAVVTIPVKVGEDIVGEARLAFKFNAVCVAVLTGNVDATLDAVSSLRGTAETLATKGQALDQAVARVLAGLQQAA